MIMYFAPEISDKDLREGNFPTIRALWYESVGLGLFALLSDNTLRMWKLEYGPKSYVMEQQAAAAKTQTEEVKPTPDPEPVQPM